MGCGTSILYLASEKDQQEIIDACLTPHHRAKLQLWIDDMDDNIRSPVPSIHSFDDDDNVNENNENNENENENNNNTTNGNNSNNSSIHSRSPNISSVIVDMREIKKLERQTFQDDTVDDLDPDFKPARPLTFENMRLLQSQFANKQKLSERNSDSSFVVNAIASQMSPRELPGSPLYKRKQQLLPLVAPVAPIDSSKMPDITATATSADVNMRLASCSEIQKEDANGFASSAVSCSF